MFNPMELHAVADGSGVPLAVLLKRELCNQRVEKPDILSGEANKSKKGEDFTLLVPKCRRTPGEGAGDSAAGDDDTISVFAVMPRCLCSHFCSTIHVFPILFSFSLSTICFDIIASEIDSVSSSIVVRPN
jgi:hypothetical protein